MTSSRRELDDTAPATEVPSEPARRARSDTFIPPGERYQLGAEIGRGGMGRVVEAVDTKLGRTVALKEVLPSAGEAVERRFLREVRVTARLEHPSIVPLYDSGVTAEGRPFYVMRRVSGRPLDELIKRARGLDERLTLLPAVLRAIDAIAHAHKRGVIHRDLKPANILVGEHGESVVIDWGLAKVIGEADPEEPDSLSELKAGDSLQTQYGAVFGTPGFMPPEQARGEALGFDGDVYALGATLYQLLAGAPPHRGASVTDVMDRTIRVEVTPLRALAPGTPVELAAIVDKALAYEAGHRYRDAGELAEDVRRFEAGQLVAAHHYTTRQRVRRFVRRHRSLLLVGAIALGALTVFGVLSLQRLYAEKRAAQEARDAAERNANQLQDQAHELTLANASALVSTNPTKALAYLKHIPARSRFEQRARSLAQSAFARGIAWGMQIPPAPRRIASLSPSESRLLWQDLESELRVYDLDERRLLLTRAVSGTARGSWVDDARIVLTGKDPVLIDVTTGAVRELALPPVAMWGTGNGEVAVAKLEDGGVRIVNLLTGAITTVEGEATWLATMSSRGTWSAIDGTSDEVVFHDVAGRELGRIDLDTRWAFPMFDDSIVVGGDYNVFRCHRDHVPMCTEIVLGLSPNERIMAVNPMDSALVVATSRLQVFVVDGGATHRFAPPSNSASSIVSNSHVVFGSDRDTMYVPTRAGWLPLDVPLPVMKARVIVGARRIVVLSGAVAAVFESAKWIPRRLALHGSDEVTFANDDLLVTRRSMMTNVVEWFDARSLVSTARFEFPRPLLGVQVAPTGALVGTMFPGGDPGGRIDVAYVPSGGGTLEPVTTSETSPLVDMFADGTALVVRDGREVVSYPPGGPVSKALELPGRPVSLSIYDTRRFISLLDTNELVIGDLSTNTLQRFPIDAVPPNGVVVTRGATTFVVLGRKVAVWRDAHLVPIGEWPMDTEWVVFSERRLLARLADKSTVQMDPETGVTSTLYEPSLGLLWLNQRATIAASVSSSTRLEILELDTQLRWDLPLSYEKEEPFLAISDDATQLIVTTTAHSFVHRLHRVGPDYQAWLAGATNALITDGKLTWDWDSTARLAP